MCCWIVCFYFSSTKPKLLPNRNWRNFVILQISLIFSDVMKKCEILTKNAYGQTHSVKMVTKGALPWFSLLFASHSEQDSKVNWSRKADKSFAGTSDSWLWFKSDTLVMTELTIAWPLVRNNLKGLEYIRLLLIRFFERSRRISPNISRQSFLILHLFPLLTSNFVYHAFCSFHALLRTCNGFNDEKRTHIVNDNFKKR